VVLAGADPSGVRIDFFSSLTRCPAKAPASRRISADGRIRPVTIGRGTMPAFKSARAYREFAQQVTRSSRYVRGLDSEEFLRTLLREAQSRTEIMPAGAVFWRAQLGHDWEPMYDGGKHVDDVPCPLLPKRMKPLTDRAREGRANPKGIPYLYLSTHRETAMAEVRPWLASIVSVGQFKTLREIRVANCTSDKPRQRFFWRAIPPEEWDDAVWADIDDAFSQPVMPSDDQPEYVPTQIVAEIFKMNGFDAVAYRSALGSGHNLALFDVEAAVLTNCSIFDVKRLEFQFEEAGNPYFVTEHYEKGPNQE